MNQTNEKSTRLHYLDWLQVLAILGVFVFHAVNPFDELVEFHIKNVERSVLATIFSFFFSQWGMPFFFMMAGMTSWFSLRRRTAGRYLSERARQLLIPFVVGAIVLTPVMAYYELTHIGWWQGGSIAAFIRSSAARTYFYTEFRTMFPAPEVFALISYHLWFVAFLFVFSAAALPLFLWLKGDAGKRFVAWSARLARWPGGLLVFALPLAIVRFSLQPFFPAYTGWSDFAFLLVFFVSGHILIADGRFMHAIRRDRWLYLVLGVAGTLFFFSVAAGVPVFDWMGSPGTPGFYIAWTVSSLNGWCWTMVVFYVGMRFLDTTNHWLAYSREASFFFFWVHLPVNFFVAFYVVQWDVPLWIKLSVILIGSFVGSLGLYELLVRRVNPVRAFFGMKPRPH